MTPGYTYVGKVYYHRSCGCQFTVSKNYKRHQVWRVFCEYTIKSSHRNSHGKWRTVDNFKEALEYGQILLNVIESVKNLEQKKKRKRANII